MASSSICTSNARLDGKTVVITGANSGVGRCTVQDLYKRGARVVMACLSIAKGGQLAAETMASCMHEPNLGTLAVVQVDLARFRSVRGCASQLLKNESHIDILINNASVFTHEHISKDGYEIHLQVNCLGHFLLTMLLMPRIIKGQAARIINISSVMHTLVSNQLNFNDLWWTTRPHDRIQAYCKSKLANILFTIKLDQKLKEANIQHVTTYCVYPGEVAIVQPTAESAHSFNPFEPGPQLVNYNQINSFYINPEFGSQTIIYCAVDESVANESGLYYYQCAACEPTITIDRQQEATDLWNASTAMVVLPPLFNPFVPN